MMTIAIASSFAQLSRTAGVLTAIACLEAAGAGGQTPSPIAPPAAVSTPTTGSANSPQDQLARQLAAAIAGAIPEVYEKREDWDAKREITVGLEFKGKGLKQDLRRRRKLVNHGVWKHYTVRLVDPAQTLAVQVDELRPAGDGRMAFAMHVDAKIDAWGRARVFQNGVHIVSLQAEADARLHFEVAGEVAVRFVAAGAATGLAVDPVITRADVRFDEFELRNVSRAHGPVVKELGDGLKRVLESKLDEPVLVAKLNRAIEKKRDKLQIELWGPTAAPSEALATEQPRPH